MSGQPDGLMEFFCPEDDSSYPYACTDLCEGKGMNDGCLHLKTCDFYLKQKVFQAENPAASWKITIHKDTNKGYEEMHTTLVMIKKGIITPPKRVDNLKGVSLEKENNIEVKQ